MRKVNKSLSGYRPLCEEEALRIQCACQADLSHGLALLTTLVDTADISQEDRTQLRATIIHLCHHIAGETREIKTNMKDRRN